MYATQVSPSPTGTNGSVLSFAENVHITGFEQNYEEVKTPTKLSSTRKRIIALLSKFMSIKIIIVVSFVLLTIIPSAIILGVVLSYLQNVTQLEITRTAGMQSKSVVLYVGDFLLTPFKACQALSNVLPANIVSTPSLKNFIFSTIQTNSNLKKALVIFDNDGTSLGMSTLATPQGSAKYQQEVLLNLTSTISNVNANGDPIQLVSQYSNDLRQWELYLDGMFNQQPVWSPVYSTGGGSDDNSLAITACVPSFSRDLTVAYGMASCDVGISTINEFLGQLNISSGSSVYLVERYEWRMIANSNVYDKVMGNNGARKQLTNSTNVYIAELGKQLQKTYGDYDKEAHSGPYSLLNKDFTVEFVRLRDDYGLDWYVLVVLDNNDFTGTIYQFRDVVLIVAGSVAAGSIVFGIILSLMITRPLDVLGHKMDSFRRMDESTKKKSIFSIIPNSFFHEVKVLQKNYRNMKHTVQAFVKYVPKEIVRDLLDRSEPALFKPFVVQTNLAILFSDIADFTTISEKMDPSTLVCLITLYFEQVSRVISEYGGMILNTCSNS
jgi:flagellar biosynthesis protein FliQ